MNFKSVPSMRFLFSVAIGAIMLFGTMGLIVAAADRLDGGLGLTLAIIGGICLALGILLVYWTTVDRLNLKVIRHSLANGFSKLENGTVVAFEGKAQVEGQPMTAPFSDRLCAAYNYIASINVSDRSVSDENRSGSTRRVIAQGFHMLPTQIVGHGESLRLYALPGFEDDMRLANESDRWTAKARDFVKQLKERAGPAEEDERQSKLLHVRHERTEEVHQDYCMGTIPESYFNPTIEEEALPVDETLCVIGTYNVGLHGLTAEKKRMGPNMMVYQGTAKHVLERMSKDVKGFTKVSFWLLSIAAVVFALAFLPQEWTSNLPVLGGLVTPHT